MEYEAFTVGDASVVSLAGSAQAVRDALETGTLHAWASRQAGARPLEGRGTAWAVALADGSDVVVRHSHHGGAFARLTADLFLAPTRAPRELEIALRLARAGVRTPEVVAYAVYPAFGPFARADVVTRRVRGDVFPNAWRAGVGPERRDAVRALALLLRQLRAAGAQHPDLNLRNVLVSVREHPPVAFVLDVDRIEFGEAGSAAIARRNLERVLRSARKWRHVWGIDLEDRENMLELAPSLPGEPARHRE